MTTTSGGFADFYEVLGVDENATPDQIKTAFHELAKQLHPDRNRGNSEAERQFKEVEYAYSVLSSPFKRKEFDEKLRESRIPKSPILRLSSSVIDFGTLRPGMSKGLYVLAYSEGAEGELDLSSYSGAFWSAAFEYPHDDDDPAASMRIVFVAEVDDYSELGPFEDTLIVFLSSGDEVSPKRLVIRVNIEATPRSTLPPRATSARTPPPPASPVLLPSVSPVAFFWRPGIVQWLIVAAAWIGTLAAGLNLFIRHYDAIPFFAYPYVPALLGVIVVASVYTTLGGASEQTFDILASSGINFALAFYLHSLYVQGMMDFTDMREGRYGFIVAIVAVVVGIAATIGCLIGSLWLPFWDLSDLKFGRLTLYASMFMLSGYWLTALIAIMHGENLFP